MEPQRENLSSLLSSAAAEGLDVHAKTRADFETALSARHGAKPGLRVQGGTVCR